MQLDDQETHTSLPAVPSEHDAEACLVDETLGRCSARGARYDCSSIIPSVPLFCSLLLLTASLCALALQLTWQNEQAVTLG